MGIPDVPSGGDDATDMPLIRLVSVRTEQGHWFGTPVFMPNPHCVVVVNAIHDAGHLFTAPDMTGPGADIFPEGANVEFIEQRAQDRIGMRTYERGVGETLSCGSGACAAAFVWAQHQSMTAPWKVSVDVLGGTVVVEADDQGVLTLRGPAVVVAKGQLVGGQWTS